MEKLIDYLSKKAYGMPLSKAHAKRVCIQCRNKIKHFSKDEFRISYEFNGLCERCQNEE